MQEEKRKLDEAIHAFEAENMRLTNEVEEMKYLRLEKTELESVHNETNKVLSSQLHVLTVDKLDLTNKVQELEREMQRLTNEREEMQYAAVEKNELEKINQQLQRELGKLRSNGL
jgi:lipid II:glycine glycyltransferase (peptidoglycan interpeptide bridge formation enzyme)